MEKKRKVILGIIALITIGGIIYIISKRIKSRKECEKKGGKWNAKTKSCDIIAPNDLQEVIAKAYDNLNFKVNSAEIINTSFPYLDEMAKYLNDNPIFTLTITGHTDSQGSDSFNQKLSENRALSVKKYLVSKGVDEKRIQSFGKGETEPIADNNTEEGRKQNRRVVFVISKQEVETVTP